MSSVISSIFGGGQSAPTQPNTQIYQPAGTGTADTQLQSINTQNANAVTGTNNPYSQLSPQLLQVFQSLFNNPTAGGYTGAAANSGAQSTAIGNQGVGASGTLNTSALNLLPGAQQVANLGLDPQSQLYNQQLQQTNDQANVNNAQYGLTGQQAVSNVNQADTNFNIDWQNNELQRAIAGLGAAGSTVSKASTAASTANNIGAAGASNTALGGQTPYVANQTVGANQTQALQNYITQLLGPVTSSQSVAGDLQTYLNEGVTASNAAASQALKDYEAQETAQSNLGAGIGGLLNYATPNSSGGSSGLGNLLSQFSGLFSSSGSAAGASGFDDLASYGADFLAA